MSYYYSVCISELYHQKYIEFLLEHYKDLNLPYSFPVSLGLLASPMILERTPFLCFTDEYELVGAFGIIFGTGENAYEDKQIVQIQIAYLQEEHRKPGVFLRGLQYMVQYLDQLETEVTEFRFLTAPDDYLNRLFAKIATKTASHETAFGTIDEYRASFAAWKAYAARFHQETYF